MSTADEYSLGQALLKQLRAQLPVAKDLVSESYLENLGSQLLTYAPNIEYPFRFVLIEDDSINAFATPGGIIVVHTGLIAATDNESELAGVLAHEIAHVAQRHIARFYAKANKLNLGTTLGMLAAIIAASQSPEAAQAMLYTGVAANASAQLGFSRDNETEADRIGKQILTNAGFDPSAMSRFFGRLQDETLGQRDAATEFLRTHPHPITRIADSLNVLPAEHQGRRDSQQFELIRAAIIARFGNQTAPVVIATNPALQRFFKAAVAVARHQYASAQQLLEQLPLSWQHLTPVQLLKAETFIAQIRYSEAISVLETLNANYPRQPATLELLARSYLLNQEPRKAYRLLVQADSLLDQWPELLKLKADAAAHAALPLQSHITLARYYEQTGSLDQAIAQVEYAQALPELSTSTTAKLDQLKLQLQKQQLTLSAR